MDKLIKNDNFGVKGMFKNSDILWVAEKAVEKIGADNCMYILLGIIVAAFLIAVIASFIGGEFNRFRRAAKYAVKTSDVDAAAEKLPEGVKRLYKKDKSLLSIEACVHSTFKRSPAKYVGKITLAATIFIALLIIALLYSGIAELAPALILVAVLGAILTAVSYCISALILKSGVKCYEKLVRLLDEKETVAEEKTDYFAENVQTDYGFNDYNATPAPAPIAENNFDAFDAADAERKASLAATEDIIHRINNIDGASITVMKEVADLIQKERQKPENKTPEQKQKLDDAMLKLINAIKSATANS